MSPETLQILRLAFELALVVALAVFGTKAKRFKTLLRDILEVLRDVLDEDSKDTINKKVGKRIL